MQKTYEIAFTKNAEKFFKTHPDVLKLYIKALNSLLFGENPAAVDIKRIKGKNGEYYRIRIGDCRVIYTIINGKIVVVMTLAAGNRGDIYKKLNGLK